ncbi:MFS transporter [Natronolimnohabitans innermongolicus]|uniref:Lysosomal dipeptide transporter MFSD1 n=1 Tax=Natronolimnohabitans innermongolicus JCM 12255 TaxID=1227499 RepID=L9X6W1_9EURY|nr:MFS transporter [Natronolimnohabitans innermongolicus]ELY57494.1 major facilitator superfamily protein [Natronolimnohabitans innermongolicus JCM 12255]
MSFRSPTALSRVWTNPYYRRWLLWGILAASFLLVSIYRLSTAVIAGQLMDAFEITGAELGLLHAAFFVIYSLMQIPVGILVDRIGARRTAAVGAVVMNVGAVWFALAGGYGGALAGRFLIGLGGSVIFVAMLRFCANWYRTDEFATMNGLCFAVGGVGGIIATTPFAVAVDVAGWRTAVLGLGAAGLVVAAATFVFVRDSAERAGLPAIDGVPEQSMLTIPEVRQFTARIVTDRMTWVVSLLLYCTGGVNLTLVGLWGIPYVVQTYDVSVTTASTITLCGGVGLVVGPPAVGRLSDRLERDTEFIVAGTAIYTVALGFLAVAGDPPLVTVGAVFFLTGALFGTFALTYPLVQTRYDERASGIAIGAINGASFFGAATFPTLMGWALDAYWTGEFIDGARVYTETGYRIAFVIGTVAGFVALCCAVWIHVTDHE